MSNRAGYSLGTHFTSWVGKSCSGWIDAIHPGGFAHRDATIDRIVPNISSAAAELMIQMYTNVSVTTDSAIE